MTDVEPPEGGGLDTNEAIERSRVGLLGSLVLISVALAAAVSVMISAARGELPRVPGLDYRVVQVGLVLLVLAFALYIFERERQFRRIQRRLLAERAEGMRLSAEIEFLRRIETERDTVAALLLASADGILVVGTDRKIDQMNPAMEALTGIRQENASGMSCEDLFRCHREGTLACGFCPFEQVLRSGREVREHSFPMLRMNGTTAWLAGAYAPVRAPDGGIAFAIGSLRDATRGKELEHLQHDFVSIVSHELRGPLTAIKGFIGTLVAKRSQLSPDAQDDFLQTISEQSDRLNQLVEDLLNVSRIESRRLKLKTSPIRLPELANKLVDQFRSQWQEREIVIAAPEDLPPVLGDETRLAEVFINLIDNAMKYSPNGGPVRVSMQPSGDQVEVSVEDSGIGIPPEEVLRLFEKFHRVASPETRDIGGTGLGLFIVKNLVEAHGGRIWVTSVPGVGSTFSFTLPQDGPTAPVHYSSEK